MEASAAVKNVLNSFSPFVEMCSVDEAVLDLTGCTMLWGNPEQMVNLVKERIRVEVGLTCSVGVAATRHLAKYASEINKPDGYFIIYPGDMYEIISRIEIGKISGVGPKSLKILNRLGIYKLGDVLKLPREYWNSRLGRYGNWLFNIASGLEVDNIHHDRKVKSIGKEYTLLKDTDDYNELKRHLMYIAYNLSWRLRRGKYKCRTISIKIRDSSFFTSSIQETLPERTFFAEDIFRTAVILLKKVNLKVKTIRLIGISLTGLTDTENGEQLSLFNYKDKEKKLKLAEATDAIWDRFGKFKVKPASLLP